MKVHRMGFVTKIAAVILALFTLATPVLAASTHDSGDGTVTVSNYALDYKWITTYEKADVSQDGDNDGGSGSVSLSNTEFTLKAKSSKYKAKAWNNWTQDIVYNYTTRLTIINNGAYGCKITYNTSGNMGTVTGATVELAKGASTSFTLATTTAATSTTRQDLTGTVTITGIEVYDKVKVGFAASPKGAYTYTIGETTTEVEPGAETAKQEMAANSTITLTAGEAAKGYVFYGWMSSGTLLSKDSTYNYEVNLSGDIYPAFIPDEMKNAGEPFKVGDNSYMFWHLAFEAAALSGNPVRVDQSTTLPTSLIDNGLLDGHKYTDYISVENGVVKYVVTSGTKLLVPFGDGDTAGSFGALPGNYLSESEACTLFDKSGISTRNFVYRSLTVPSGTKIDCYGAINVNGQRQETGQPYMGVTVGGYGKIQLDGTNTEQLTIHKGGKLYCYGYITGSGSVSVEGGGDVHELLQICDWVGGSNALGWYFAQDTNTLFLTSHFYVQNIETTLTVKPGANAYAEAVIHGSDETIPRSVPFIGTTGFLNLTGESYVVRTYDTATDRVEYTLYGNVEMGEISISFDYITTYTLKSSDNVIAIPSNMTLRVASGSNVSFNQRVALLPGSELIVDENATLNIGGQMHIVDVAGYSKSYFFDRTGMTLKSGHSFKNTSPKFNALPYVATLDNVSPRTHKLVRGSVTSDGKTSQKYYMDAKTLSDSANVTVNGTLNVSGALLNTTGGTTPSLDKLVNGTGTINYTGNHGITNLKGGYNGTINTMTSTYAGVTDTVTVTGLTPTTVQLVASNVAVPYSSYRMLVPSGKSLSAYFTDISCTTAATSDNVGGTVYFKTGAAAKAAIGPEAGVYTKAFTGTIADAVNAATGENDYVTVLADRTLSTKIEVGKTQNITLDLGGKTLKGGTSTSREPLTNNGILRLINGTITYEAKGTSSKTLATVRNNGTIEYIEDVILKQTGNGSTYGYALYNASNASIGEIRSGEFRTYGQSAGYPIYTLGEIGTIGTSGKTVTIYGRRGIEMSGSAAKITTLGGAGSTVNITGGQRGIDLLSGASVVTIGEVGSTVNFYTGGYTMHKSCIFVDNKSSITTVGGVGSTVNFSLEPKDDAGMESYVFNLGSGSKIETIGAAGSTITINGVSAQTGHSVNEKNADGTPKSYYSNHMYGIINKGTITNIGSSAATVNKIAYPASKLIINVAHSGLYGHLAGIRNDGGTINNLGAEGASIQISSSFTSESTDRYGYGIYNSGTINNLGAGANVQIVCNKTAIYNTSKTIGNMTGVIAISTGDTNATINRASGTFSVASGYLYNGGTKLTSGTITYLNGSKLSTNTIPVTLADGSVYECYGIVAAHDHVYEDNAAFTWTEGDDGYTVTVAAKCTVFGCTEIVSGTAEVVKTGESATCTDEGYTAYTATITFGNKEYSEIKTETVSKLGHAYGDLIPTADPVHTQTELKASVAEHYQCSVCSKYFAADKQETTLEALTGATPVHSYGEWINTDAEKHWKECSCGLKSEEAAHSDSDDTDSLCDTCGYQMHTCSGTLANGQAADCTNNGWLDYLTCSCGKYYSDADCKNEITDLEAWKTGVGKIDASHNYGDLIPATDPVHTQTELEAGVAAHYQCSVCSKYFDAGKQETTLDALTGEMPEHNYSKVVTDPTCTAGGYTTYTCSCGDSYTADAVEALGHTEGEAVTENEKAATCTEDGSYDTVVYCTVCKAELRRVTTTVAAVGHKYNAVVTAPTCTADGYTTYTCSCGDTYTSDSVLATGHNYEAVVTEPTCTEEGYTTYTCSCGDNYVADKVAATGHSYDDGVVTKVPTVNEKGTMTYTCFVCGVTKTKDIEMKPAAARIGEINYETLAAAIEAAQEGDEIVLLTKATVSGNETWDLTGKTLTSVAVDDNYSIVISGELTIVGGTFNVNGVYGIGVTGKLTVTGGTFNAGKINDYLIGNWGTTAISGGEFNGVYNCVNNFAGTTTITDGKFNTAEFDYTGEYESADVFADAGMSISGGTFSKPVEESHCAAGFIPNANEDGTYGVVEGSYVAQIGDTKYTSLTAAIEAASANDTITLLDDVVLTEKLVIDSDKKITMNFGDHSLTTCAVDDNYGFVVKGDLTIAGGTFHVNGVYGIGVTGNLTVTGGTFNAGATNDYLIGNWGTTTISGGEFKGVYNCVNNFGGTTTITGGNFTTEATDCTGEYESADVLADAGMSISGGIFSKPVEESHCAAGYIPTEKDGSYGVKIGAYEAQIGETKYETLADAIAAAEENAEVILLADIELTEKLSISKKVTLDLNGKTITTAIVDDYAPIYVGVSGELTVTGNGTVISENDIVFGNFGMITIEDGTFCSNAAEYNAALYNMYHNGTTYGKAVINGGTFESPVWNSGELTVNSGELNGLDNSGKTVITGGTVNGEITAGDGSDAPELSENGTIAISGGVFVNAVEKTWCAEGYCPATNEDGTYGVQQHTEETISGTAATCTEPGLTEGKKCTICGETLVEQTIIDALGHDMVTDAAVAPDCVNTGLTEGSHCSRCDDATTEQNEVAALGHSYAAPVITWVEGETVSATAAVICDICEEDDVATVVVTAGDPVAGNCQTKSSITYIATATYGDLTSTDAKTVYGELGNHALVSHVANDATCEASGNNAYYACSVANCGKYFSDAEGKTEIAENSWIIPELNHVGTTVTYTDNGDGTHKVVCACGEVIGTESHSYDETTGECVCGAVKKPEELVDPNLTFTTKAINLAAYIGAQFEVNAGAIAVGDYDSVYVSVAKNGTEYILSENIGADYKTSEGYQRYIFEYTLAAKEMADVLTLTVYGVKDDVTYEGESVNWSVREGAWDRLDMYYPYINHATQGQAYRNRCVLIVDMLNYGAEAQRCFSYNTENLANANLRDEYASLATVKEPEIGAYNTAKNTAVNQLYAYNLGLAEKVEMQFTFRLESSDYTGYMVKVNWNGTTYEYGTDSFIPLDNYPQFVTVIFDELNARYMRDTVTVELYRNGVLVSQTYTASIEGTAKMLVDAGKNVDVIKAMLKYGDAAAKSLNK